MTKAWWTGAALLMLGLAWQITDQVLQTLYPLSWGGPNIGGFVIYFAAQVVAGAGLITMVATAALLLSHRVRLSKVTLLVPLLAAALLVVGLLSLDLGAPVLEQLVLLQLLAAENEIMG